MECTSFYGRTLVDIIEDLYFCENEEIIELTTIILDGHLHYEEDFFF